MSGMFGLSCNIEKEKNFEEDFFWGTFYQQHFDEQWSGLGVLNNGNIKRDTRPGLLRANFGKYQKEFSGTEGIGYCGNDKEPLKMETKIGTFCLCFSGNIRNFLKLKEELKDLGVTFRGREEEYSQIEVIGDLIARSRKDIPSGIKIVMRKIEGSCTLLVLAEEGIFAVRSPDGRWPLTIGEKEGEVAIASSSAGFNNLGFKVKRDLKSGEIVFLKNGWLRSKGMIAAKEPRTCSFLWVYSDFPSGSYNGISASLVRKRLGAILAQRDIERGFIPDIVAPIPDSGRFHATGYHQEFCNQVNQGKIDKVPIYNEYLLKYPYAGRSYTPKEKKRREQEANIKILPVNEDCNGSVIVLVDDSIVRGTQTKTNLVPKIKKLGIKEIHLRIANPELLSHCPWGKTTKKGECLALHMPSIKERIRFLGIKSLEYNTIPDLVKAIGLPKEKLCVDCSLPE